MIGLMVAGGMLVAYVGILLWMTGGMGENDEP